MKVFQFLSSKRNYFLFSKFVCFAFIYFRTCNGDKYPLLNSIPETSFSCWQRLPGYYADAENSTQCQVYHMCQAGGRMFSYLCPNHTLFDQDRLICDHWYKVDCTDIENRYKINEENFSESLAKIPNKKKEDSGSLIANVPSPASIKPVIPEKNKGNSTKTLANDEETNYEDVEGQTEIIPKRNELKRTTTTTTTIRPRSFGIRRRNRILIKPSKNDGHNDDTSNGTSNGGGAGEEEEEERRTTQSTLRIINKISQDINSVLSFESECQGCLQYFMKDKVKCTPCVLPR